MFAKFDWKGIKDMVEMYNQQMFDSITEANILSAKSMSFQTDHGKKSKFGASKTHTMTRYSFMKESQIGYDIEFTWTICRECRTTFKKEIIAWNHRGGVSFSKLLYKSNFVT